MCADIYMAGAGTKRRTGKSTKLRRLLCHRCSKSFKSVQTLTVHMGVCAYRNCEPRFKCTQCDKRFRTWLQFSRHVYYTHSDRSFTCTEVDCGRSFTSRSHLIAHHAIHTATRPYVCPFEGCTYRARTTGRLFQHKVIHGEGRRFSCDYCDYSATTSSNLRRHARIHAGARPYLCPHCDHRTSTLDALKKHVLDSGRHPGLPLYVCPWCSDTEIRDPGAPERFWSNCVGFNASGLAWRHLTAEHQDRIIKSARLKALGRSSDKILLERDVTRLLGIYCPEVDSIQPPVNVAVRQPAVLSRHRRRKDGTITEEKPIDVSQTSGRINTVDTQEGLERQSNAATALTQTNMPINANSDQLISTEHSTSSPQSTMDSTMQEPTIGLKQQMDNIVSIYRLVQLGSGALWSRDAFIPCDNPLTNG